MFAFPFGAEPGIVALGGFISFSFCFSADLGSSIRGASGYSSCLRVSSQQRFDLFHVRMSNPRRLELFEVIQRGLAKGPSIVELGILVLQIDGLRLIELVIEEITMSEIALDHHCIVRRQLQSFERRCNRLTRLAIEELIPTEGSVVASVFRIQVNSFLNIVDRGTILLLFNPNVTAFLESSLMARSRSAIAPSQSSYCALALPRLA